MEDGGQGLQECSSLLQVLLLSSLVVRNSISEGVGSRSVCCQSECVVRSVTTRVVGRTVRYLLRRPKAFGAWLGNSFTGGADERANSCQHE